MNNDVSIQRINNIILETSGDDGNNYYVVIRPLDASQTTASFTVRYSGEMECEIYCPFEEMEVMPIESPGEIDATSGVLDTFFSKFETTIPDDAAV